jgi:hypothetical protein
MTRFLLAISLFCYACAGKAPIEGQLSHDVEKDAFDWDDPGASPDPPRDGGVAPDGGSPAMDAAVEMDGAVDAASAQDDAG